MDQLRFRNILFQIIFRMDQLSSVYYGFVAVEYLDRFYLNFLFKYFVQYFGLISSTEWISWDSGKFSLKFPFERSNWVSVFWIQISFRTNKLRFWMIFFQICFRTDQLIFWIFFQFLLRMIYLRFWYISFAYH